MKSLNHVYRTIWSEALGAWIAVSEITKSKGKRSASSVIRAIRLVRGAADGDMLRASIKPLFVAVACCFALNAQANPMGGAVVNGSATFNSTGNTLTVTNTPGTIINWQNFSIDAGEVTHFAQQSAASTVLNRVVTNNPSNILGTLSSNGQVYLLNANGIMFGAGATVDVAGLVATSLNLSDADFLAGRHDFTAVDGAQNISNAGNINAQQGGQIYLIAPNVENTGIITAPGGEVLLAAGHSVQIVNSNDPALRVEITAPAGEATNLGQLIVGSGKLGLFGAVVKNSGLASADSAVMEGGRIVFKSSQRTEAGGTISASGTGGGRIDILSDMQTGTVEVSGTLEAKASGSGDGGFVETSAANVHIADTTRVSTLAANGKNGTWLIDPTDFTIAASGGDITGATLGANLANNDVTITAPGTGTTGNGDIFVNDAVTWTCAGTSCALTLNAWRNIYINQDITGISQTGSAQLNLLYGQGAVAANNTADYYLAAGTRVNLSAGFNFSTQLGSDGTSNSYYVITTLGNMGSGTGTDLQGMQGNLTRNYVLGADINAEMTSLDTGWNSVGGFAPVGSSFGIYYVGKFDGLGHTISNLYINRPATNYVGLFGYTNFGASFRNVGLVNANVTGSYYVGGLVGYHYYSQGMSNCYVTSSAISGLRNVGGLVGQNSVSPIRDSYVSSSTVSGSSMVGGLVGQNYILSSIDNGTVSATSVTGSTFVGGLVGYNSSPINSSNVGGGAVDGVNHVGGLTGYNESTVSNSHYDIGATLINDGNIVTLGALYSPQYADWINNSRTLNIASYSSTLAPLGGNTYSISTVQGMQDMLGFADNAAYTFRLGASFDLAPLPGFYIPYLAADFNGAGFTLSNLGVTQVFNNNIGLFGHVLNGSTVSNLTLLTPTVIGLNVVGSVAGRNEGIIDNIHVTGGTVVGEYDVGGLVGHDYDGDILNSDFSGAVVGTQNVGGLVGSAYLALLDGNHVSTSGVGGSSYIGGLVGYAQDATISNSYVGSGTVVSGVNNVGGLLGSDGGEGSAVILNTSVTGATITGTTSYVGGLVGYMGGGYSSTGYIRDSSVTTTTVTGDAYVGGLVGYNWGEISASFVNNATVSGNSFVGGLVGYNGNTSSFNGIVFGGIISTSYVTGGVVNGGGEAGATLGVGGLVGTNAGLVTSSYVDGGSVSATCTDCGGGAGGLVGVNTGTISSSYASNGNVSGAQFDGGLAGTNDGVISDTYVSNMDVSGTTGSWSWIYVGGIAGNNLGDISNSYVNGGSIDGGGSVGGVVGNNDPYGGGIVSGSYWNTALIGGNLTNGIGFDGNGPSDTGATGLTTTEMMTMASFTGWDIASSSGTGSVWYIIEGQTMPLLNGVAGGSVVEAPPITNPLLDALVGGIADTEERKNWEVDEYAEGDGVVTQDGSLPVCR